MSPNSSHLERQKAILELDQKLSKRFIALDHNGYFLIRLDHDKQELIVELFENEIDSTGRALDPETGKPISCNEDVKRKPKRIYKSTSAKEMGIQLTETDPPYPISRIDHALYLGRELQKAEACLINGIQYVQD